MSVDHAFLDAASTSVPKFLADFGLHEEIVRRISEEKHEPRWLLAKRLEGWRRFQAAPWPAWGPSLAALDLERIRFFVQPDTVEATTWADVPPDIRETFDKLGIPEAERAGLGGVGAQFDSEVVYHKLREDLAAQGVVFLNMDEAVHTHEEMVRRYFMTRCVPVHDHPFAMLHAAVWSGGTFIYVPRGVRVDVPLQAYFRMNAARGGQFEHTLIIADEGAHLEYIEGCSAPRFDAAALHAGCVEIFVGVSAHVTYASMENWSKNTYNLNTKRAIVAQEGEISWVSGNMGSCTTMLYPMSVLQGDRARSTFLGIAVAGRGQEQDTGHKVALLGAQTSAYARSKSICVDGGVSSYRGLVHVGGKAQRAAVHTICDALMMDDRSCSRTIPVTRSENATASITHEARCGRVNDAVLTYLQTRGIGRRDATRMVITGFVDEIARALPLEYAVELLRLVELESETW